MKRHETATRRLPIIAVGLMAIALPGCVIIANDDPSGTLDTRLTKATSMSTPFMVTTQSVYDFDTTLARLTSGVDARGLKTFAVIDHAKGAASIDASLRPTTLVIFGNPKGGTPLMQAAQSIGFDLPLKALVHEDANGSVFISVSDIDALFDAHSDGPPPPPVAAISTMLSGLADEAGT